MFYIATNHCPDRLPPKWLLLLMELRSPYLATATVPVLLGTSLAFFRTGIWNWPLFLLTLIGMVLIHIGINIIRDCANHYSIDDMQFGLPSSTEVLCVGLFCVSAGGFIGIYLALKAGAFVLLLGVIGMTAGFCYAVPQLSISARALGKSIIALTYGILPAVGAYYVQTRTLELGVVVLSLPAAFLVVSVLLTSRSKEYSIDRVSEKWRLGEVHMLTVAMHLAVGSLLSAALIISRHVS